MIILGIRRTIFCRNDLLMRTFDYIKIPNELLDFDIINLITKIHEYKGKQELYKKAKP